MRAVLIDSNILLDIFTRDAVWLEWSSAQLSALAVDHRLVINPIIYSEISYRFSNMIALDAALSAVAFHRDALPWDAAFLAAKCHMAYREHGGSRQMILPDFYIGAHASVAGMRLLTRDANRYRSYFADLDIIAP